MLTADLTSLSTSLPSCPGAQPGAVRRWLAYTVRSSGQLLHQAGPPFLLTPTPASPEHICCCPIGALQQLGGHVAGISLLGLASTG